MKKLAGIIFLTLFFLILPSAKSVQAAAGCCVTSVGNGTPGKGACLKNIKDQRECIGGRFYDGDSNCSSRQECPRDMQDMPGCCVKDTTRSGINPDNCVSNSTQIKCSSFGLKFAFYAGDVNCEQAGAKQFCGSPVPAPVGGGDGTVNPEFTNPLRFTTVSEALNVLIEHLQGIVALISIVFIIVGGIMYMTAGVDEKMVERAKQTIGGATIGFAIILAAPTFLKEIKKILGGSSGENADEWVEKAFTIKDIALRVIDFLLSVVGVLAIIGLVVGGIFYLTAYGDEEQMKKGKNFATYSIIGIAIALAALVIVRQIAKIMGAPIQ